MIESSSVFFILLLALGAVALFGPIGFAIGAIAIAAVLSFAVMVMIGAVAAGDAHRRTQRKGE